MLAGGVQFSEQNLREPLNNSSPSVAGLDLGGKRYQEGLNQVSVLGRDMTQGLSAVHLREPTHVIFHLELVVEYNAVRGITLGDRAQLIFDPEQA